MGNIEEVNPLRLYLGREGFFVYTAILSGHATEGAIPNYDVWLNEVNEQFEKFLSYHEEIVIIGFSMGGILASYLFKRKTYKIKSVILISASFLHVYFHNIKYSVKAINELRMNIREKGIKHQYNNVKNKDVVKGVKELKKLSQRAIDENWLKRINRPIFIIQGNKDGVIKKENPLYIYNNVSSSVKKIKIVEGTHHLFGLKYNYLYKEICQFINEN